MSIVTSRFVNIAGYKFVRLDRLQERRQAMRVACQNAQLKGTVLLSHEGINLFLAGPPEKVQTFLAYLRGQDEFRDFVAKESPSDHQPFSRMLVRIKKEIITLGVEGIDPAGHPSPKIAPKQLADWLREGRKIHLLDTRNDYEIEVGTFENATTLGIDSFRQFPEAIKNLPGAWKREPVVMFCTGGIRCEKAGPLMEREGFEQIYQLDGGILKYFEDCKGEKYHGDCFVFDKRVAVNPRLQETEAGLCFACQAVLSAEDQLHPHYQPPLSCPHCYRPDSEKMQDRMRDREREIARYVTPLPGSQPYDNIRPINVSAKFDGLTVIDLLSTLHGHLPREYWNEECSLGRIRYRDARLNPEIIVRAGWRIDHLLPQTVEPDVNACIRLLYEDDYLVAVDKPAPLPMHPCGRFNRNTLIHILDRIYSPNRLRMLHRLDANTSGAVVLARTKEVSRRIHPQFANGSVTKTYLALVGAVPNSDEFECNLTVSRAVSKAGGRFADAADGLPCKTKFKVLAFKDGQTLIECRPFTGRTNQIRIHLASLELPIVGDPLYKNAQDCLRDSESACSDEPTQTLAVDAPPLCLHSKELTFRHPFNNTDVTIHAPAPEWAKPFLV